MVVRRHRPWRLCCVLSGFPSLVAALQFEFRWQRALVPSQILRLLCCSVGTDGHGCCVCPTCALCNNTTPPPRRVGAAAAGGGAAVAAASAWERLQRREAAAVSGKTLHVESVIRGRVSKQPQQRLEAELQQLLLLLRCPPYSRFALVLHLLAPDVEEAVNALLTRPQCGGGVLRPGSRSNICPFLQNLPPQMTAAVASLESLRAAVLSHSGGLSAAEANFHQQLSAAGSRREEQEANGGEVCSVCRIEFSEGHSALRCPQCCSMTHLPCAAEVALAREASAASVLSSNCTAPTLSSSRRPAEESAAPLLPRRWTCCQCGADSFWALALRNVFVLQQQQQRSGSSSTERRSCPLASAPEAPSTLGNEPAFEAGCCGAASPISIASCLSSEDDAGDSPARAPPPLRRREHSMLTPGEEGAVRDEAFAAADRAALVDPQNQSSDGDSQAAVGTEPVVLPLLERISSAVWQKKASCVEIEKRARLRPPPTTGDS